MIMWRPCKPSSVCTASRVLSENFSLRQVLGQESRSTQTESRFCVMCCRKADIPDINDIHVIKSNAELIPGRTNGLEHVSMPSATTSIQR